MPIYNYACDECGSSFTAMRPLARFQDPCGCPGCGTPARRALSGAAAIASGTAGGPIADDRIERTEARPSRSSAAHPAGCGCCMRRMGLPGALSAAGRVFTSHGPVRRGGH